MVNFSALHFNNIGFQLLPSASQSGGIIDTYKDLSEKKDEYVAVLIANDRKTDKRASATTIGAYGSLLLCAAKFGIRLGNKSKPFKNPIIEYLINGVSSHINFMNKYNIGRNPIVNKLLGYGTYIGWSAIVGGGLGFLFDWYGTARNTIVNGRISNTTAGLNGSWIQSGLKSLSASQKGREIIKNSINKNADESVTVKFKGINKEYTISKQELKDASRSYIASKNETENKVTGFKKKFSKGDGDVLAFEVAFEKYCKDVKNNVIPPDENIPLHNIETSDNNILFGDNSVNTLYYMMTGKKAEEYNTETDERNDNIMNIYSKIGIKRFLHNYSQNPEKYAGEIKLKETDNNILKIRDKQYILQDLKTDKNYAIANVDSKYVTLSNSEKTKEHTEVPISKINEHIASVKCVKLDD